MRIILTVLILLASQAHAELVVIGNPKSEVNGLTPAQVEEIFMGRTQTYPNGKPAQAIDQTSGLRAMFYQRLVARPLQQIDAYWARIVFTGKDSPPPQLPDDDSVIAEVRKNPTALGYVGKRPTAREVRVLLVLP